MTLHAIAAALGGDLYAGGSRASIPAPGHSAADRSVSLWLTDGRVVIHGFGDVDWRAARDDLYARGFVDDAGRLTGGGCGRPSIPRPDRRLRLETALGLWNGTTGPASAGAAGFYLRRRAVQGVAAACNLRLHPSAPTSVYRPGGSARPALIARISDADDRLTAVELTYLDPNGLPATGLRLGRKTVGQVPPGAAVRLSPAATETRLCGPWRARSEMGGDLPFRHRSTPCPCPRSGPSRGWPGPRHSARLHWLRIPRAGAGSGAGAAWRSLAGGG